MAGLRLDDVALSSRWRRRATGEKVLLAGGLLLLAATSPSPAVSVVIGVTGVLVALAAARVPPRAYLLTLTAPTGFVLVGAVTIAVTFGAPSDTLVAVGPVAVSASSAQRAIEVATRSIAAMAALALLATTTPMNDVLRALRRIGVPAPVVEIAAVMYRMIFGLLEAVSAITDTQRARLGYRDGRSARRSVGLLAAATLRRAWVTSRRLEEGLAGRGYTGSLATMSASRSLSAPFVTASVALLVTLAGLSGVAAAGLLS